MKLRELRKARNLKLKEVAQLLNIAVSTYNGYELEKTQPDFDSLIKIANFFNVSLDYLLGRDFNNYVDKATLTEHQRKLFEFSLGFDDEMNEDFLNVLYGYVSRIEPKNHEMYKRKYE